MAEMTKEKDVRKITTPDGSIVRYSLDNKMHYWSGPAYIPQGNLKKAEYWIYGIQYTKDGHKEALRDHNGLPWHKTGLGDTRF